MINRDAFDQNKIPIEHFFQTNVHFKTSFRLVESQINMKTNFTLSSR